MDIQGLDYNTGRERLIMPEYGREIQKMADYAVGLPTKEERLRCAKSIVRLMATKVPGIRDSANYERMLWDHLFLMSHKQLDIDWPFDISEAELILTKPEPLPLPQANIQQRHYGRLVEELLEKLKTMPEGAERDALAAKTANQMKRDLATWGHGSMDDERVASDLARLTNSVIQLDLKKFTFEKVNVAQEETKKSKRKR